MRVLVFMRINLYQDDMLFCMTCQVIFQRYPQPEKEYQSFSLIYSGRSLDLVCKDKDEAEIWFAALQALISRGSTTKLRCNSKNDGFSSDSTYNYSRKSSASNVSSCSSEIIYKDQVEAPNIPVPYENSANNRLAKAFSDVLSCTTAVKAISRVESVAKSLNSLSCEDLDNQSCRSSAVDSFRSSLSSAISSSSHCSSHEDINALCEVFIWGEGIGNGLLGGGMHRIDTTASEIDALLPKALNSTVALDAQLIACGRKHAVLVTKQGQIFSWGEGTSGRLGHGVEADVSHPKLVDALGGSTIELAACGEFHTCAVTLSGDLYTWGDGTHGLGLSGSGSAVSHWKPMRVFGQREGIYVSYVSCGPWHTAAVTSVGKLFTFGDGTFGALGHGDRSSTSIPREVETLTGLRTVMTACGVWHTAAIVEVTTETSVSDNSPYGKLFTWGDGDKGQLGHGDKEPRLVPSCVVVSEGSSFRRVACGHSITIALTTSGHVYSMGIANHGLVGSLGSTNKLPTRIEGNIKNTYIEEIACGSHHIAALGSKAEVYTWGKGANGQLGHGDNKARNNPTLVEALKWKQVKTVVCGSNYTAAICLQKAISSVDNSLCSACHNQFNFRRKRQNCYNCGLVFCKACSSKKSSKAAMAPIKNKPFHVCDDCFDKLKKAREPISSSAFPRKSTGSIHSNSNEVEDRETSNSRSFAQLSRLSSFDSSKYTKIQDIKHNGKVDLNNDMASLESFMATSLPGSRRASRGTSPVSVKSSPSLAMTRNMAYANITNPESILDDSKRTDSCFTQEIALLRVQVEELTRKSQQLEEQLKRTSRQLKDATVTAQEEAEKNKSSKEQIRSLTMQLMEMAGRVSEKSMPCRKSV